MNGLERYMNMLQDRDVDFIPRIPILMQFAADYIGSNYGAFASDYRVMVDANRQCARDFGFDQLSVVSDPYRETQGFGGQVAYVTHGVPQCTKPLEKSKDLSQLAKPDPKSSLRMVNCVNAIRTYKEIAESEYSILGWVEGPAAEAADLRGTNNFLIDVMDDPEFVCDVMDVCLDVGIEFARAQVSVGADTIGIGDAVASLVSPQIYEQFIQPREKRLVQAIREMGAYVRLHICGNITHLLPGIADLGVNIIDVDHMVDLEKVRKHVGSKVTICGNINPVVVLSATPKIIRDYVEQCYTAVGNPYMVSAGCEIPTGTPVENLKALCEPLPYCKV